MNIRQVNIACIIILTSLSVACAGFRLVQSTGSAEAMRSQVHIDSHVLINTKNGEHYDIVVTALTVTAVVGASAVPTTPTNPLGSYAKPRPDNRTMPHGLNSDFAEVEVPYEAIAIMKVDHRYAVENVAPAVELAELLAVYGTDIVVAAIAVAPFVFAEPSLERLVKRHRHGGHVSLDDAYVAAFGVHIHSPDVDPDSGRVLHPNPAHLDVLYGRKRRAVGIMNGALSDLAYRYGLVAPRYALCQEVLHRDDRTYLLISVVEHAPGTWVPIDLRPSDPMEWFLPDEKTDTVLDWLAIDRTLVDDDKVDAYLLAAAVQAILDGKRAPDYWSVSKRWNDGELSEVMVLSQRHAGGTLLAN